MASLLMIAYVFDKIREAEPIVGALALMETVALALFAKKVRCFSLCSVTVLRVLPFLTISLSIFVHIYATFTYAQNSRFHPPVSSSFSDRPKT